MQEDFEKDRYFEVRDFSKEDDYGGGSFGKEYKLKKVELCNDICENYENKKEYLKNIIDYLKKIKKESILEC